MLYIQFHWAASGLAKCECFNGYKIADCESLIRCADHVWKLWSIEIEKSRKYGNVWQMVEMYLKRIRQTFGNRYQENSFSNLSMMQYQSEIKKNCQFDGGRRKIDCFWWNSSMRKIFHRLCGEKKNSLRKKSSNCYSVCKNLNFIAMEIGVCWTLNEWNLKYKYVFVYGYLTPILYFAGGVEMQLSLWIFWLVYGNVGVNNCRRILFLSLKFLDAIEWYFYWIFCQMFWHDERVLHVYVLMHIYTNIQICVHKKNVYAIA